MTIKVGLMGVGLNTYWNQFEGLFDRLEGYQKIIGGKISSYGVEVVDAGMVDSSEKVDQASRIMNEKCMEILFVFVVTYALS